MATNTLEATATQSTVQQYLDRLKRDLKNAEQELEFSQTNETKDQNDVNNKQAQETLLKNLLDMIRKTNQFGITYMASLDQMRLQGEKLKKSTDFGLRAIKVLLCQTMRVIDCTEVLRNLARQLTGRIDCKITSSGGPTSIMGSLAAVQKAADDSTTAVTEIVNSLLTSLQQQQDLWVSIAGENGLLYQVEAMKSHVATGTKKGLPDEATCRPKRQPIFPMETRNFDFYDEITKQYDIARADLSKAQETFKQATRTRQEAQSKRDALSAAYTAASTAKAGGKK